MNKIEIEELQNKWEDVQAGCDIQRGRELYRQVKVVIGPGKTQFELENAQLKKRIRQLEKGYDLLKGKLALKEK